MSTSAATHVVEVNGTEVRRYVVHAEEVGLPRGDASAILGGGPAENAEITRGVLAGEPGPQRDIAVLNAGAAIYAAGRAEGIAEGVLAAQAAIDDGQAAIALDRYIATSQESG